MLSTQLKNISQTGNLSQIGAKIKNIWNHHLENHLRPRGLLGICMLGFPGGNYFFFNQKIIPQVFFRFAPGLDPSTSPNKNSLEAKILSYSLTSKIPTREATPSNTTEVRQMKWKFKPQHPWGGEGEKYVPSWIITKSIGLVMIHHSQTCKQL